MEIKEKCAEPRWQPTTTMAGEADFATLPPLIAPSRLAKLLDMDRRRLYELLAMGELEAVRVGPKGLRITRPSLLEWLDRGGFVRSG